MSRHAALSSWGRFGGDQRGIARPRFVRHRASVANISRFLRQLEDRRRAMPPLDYVEEDSTGDQDALVAELKRRIGRGEFIRPAD